MNYQWTSHTTPWQVGYWWSMEESRWKLTHMTDKMAFSYAVMRDLIAGIWPLIFQFVNVSNYTLSNKKLCWYINVSAVPIVDLYHIHNTSLWTFSYVPRFVIVFVFLFISSHSQKSLKKKTYVTGEFFVTVNDSLNSLSPCNPYQVFSVCVNSLLLFVLGVENDCLR